ncbi:MAG: hypothetical protein CUN55_13850 [Phototrophicales bacterium]|nr:MAG: hypothetical protein CUN55_13850 [Phototrophicales bacterium]
MKQQYKIAKNFKILFVTVLLTWAGWVAAGPHMPGMPFIHPLEKMIDHLDLDDAQEKQAQEIIERVKHKTNRQKHFELVKSFILLDPDSSDYDLLSEDRANKAADELKRSILAVSKARKEIYDLLNDEQKEKLKKVVDKKLKRMEKHMARD